MPRSHLDEDDGLQTGRLELPGPSPHGLAALLLVESLLHAFVEKGLMTDGEVVEIIELAAEVEEDLLDTDRSLIGSDEGMLAPMANSFRIGHRD